MLDAKQKEWIDKQTAQMTNYVDSIGIKNLKNEDWEWIVTFAEGVTNTVEKACSSVTTIRDARNRVLDVIEKLELRYMEEMKK